MLIFHRELPLDQGFEVLDKPKQDRLVMGRPVSACSGSRLFLSMRSQPIKCWACGCEADRWIVEKGQHDRQGIPVLNLYSLRNGELVLMTRDHIIPKSLGGVDDLENLRPACETCNVARGNDVTGEDLQFRLDHPHLISPLRLNEGRNGARRAWYRPTIPEWERQKAVAPFVKLDPDFMDWIEKNPLVKPAAREL